MAPGSTQSLTEMSTWGLRRPVRRADLTTVMCRLSGNVGGSQILEPSEPVETCIGTELPFYVYALVF
jgi:hypothetical protein